MELRHLRYFVAVAEERSFTRAAERLWVAQPGLSTQIRRLETELGLKLFVRHTRGADLTQAGELFLGRAHAALAAADAAGATGRDLEAGQVGSLRLGIASGARWRPVSDVLRRFSDERPGVELTVLEAYGGTLWRDLRDGHLDALVAPAGHASPDLRALELGSEPWVVLIGAGHRLAGIGPVAAEDLNGEPIAVTGHRDGAPLDRTVAALVEELGVAPEFVPVAPGPAFGATVARNEALALTSAPDSLPAGVIIRTLAPRRSLGFELLTRDEMPSPALAGFIDLAAATAQRRPTARALAAVA
jgi:DNA-binding transcriptional LysR family regulator